MGEKTHGWVLKEIGNGFVGKDCRGDNSLKTAMVFFTRKAARESNYNAGDVVRKVRTENGVAVEVIKGR